MPEKPIEFTQLYATETSATECTGDDRVMPQILMIEDDVRLAGMLSDYLGQNGFAVTHAPDAQTGLARLSTTGMDLVILDLMLPDMDGLQVCQRIRALPGALGQVPVLMLTAKGDPMDRIIGLELGADDYLPKPFEPRELAARLQTILRRSRPAPAPATPLRPPPPPPPPRTRP